MAGSFLDRFDMKNIPVCAEEGELDAEIFMALLGG
jgi:hypothetical protein